MTEANVLETALMNAVKPSYNIHVRCPNCLKGVTTDNGEWLIWCGEKKHAEAILKAGCRYAEIEKAVKKAASDLEYVADSLYRNQLGNDGMKPHSHGTRDQMCSSALARTKAALAALRTVTDPLISGGG